MPRERATPPPFEPAWLERSLDRYLAVGVVVMLLLVAGFVTYRVREPSLRADARRQQQRSYVQIGEKLFADACASCHGDQGTGGSAPTLDSKEFLGGATDDQIESIVRSGVPGTDMSAWSIDFGGNFTDEQILQVVAYVRSWEDTAPSVPDWRRGASDAAP